MENKAVEAIEVLCDKFGIAIDWSAQNIVPYINELVGKFAAWKLWTSIMWIMPWSLITCCIWYIAWKITHSKGFDWYDYKCDGRATAAMALGAIGACLSILTFFVVCDQVQDIVTCLTFPEKAVLDYFMTLTGE